MFGHDKNKMRLMAMDKMGREKPDYPEVREEMGEEGFISFPVTQEEKAMIIAMRKEKSGEGMEEEMLEDEELELA